MDHETELNDELIELVTALRDCAPAASQINRDQLMYDAGRASMREVQPAGTSLSRLRWMWPVTTAASLMIAAFTVTSSGPGRSHEQPEQSIRVTSTDRLPGSSVSPDIAPVIAPSLIHRSPPTYLIERSQILAGRLPPVKSSSTTNDPPRPPQSPDALLHELLNETLL